MAERGRPGDDELGIGRTHLLVRRALVVVERSDQHIDERCAGHRQADEHRDQQRTPQVAADGATGDPERSPPTAHRKPPAGCRRASGGADRPVSSTMAPSRRKTTRSAQAA